jgi:hypothetical protein
MAVIKFPEITKGRANVVVQELRSNQKDSSLNREARASIDYYRLSPILNMVARKIGHMIASQRWKLYVVKDPGMRREMKKGSFEQRREVLRGRVKDTANSLNVPPEVEVVELFEHPFLDFLDGSEEPFTPYSITQLSQIYYDILGECYLYIQRNGLGMPVKWHPINPLDIEEIPEPGFPYFRFTSSTGKNSVTRMVRSKDMFCMREPDPKDPYGRGLGLGQVLADELETHENATKYLKAFFRNSARPDVLITGQDINPAAARRLESRWLDRLRGVLKQFTPFFIDLPESAKVTVLDTAFQHGGVIELKEHERNVVMQTFGLSPEVLGILTDSNKSSSEESQRITASTVVMPRMEIWRQNLQSKIASDFDEKLILDYEDPRPEERERKIGAASKMPWALRVNEHRKIIGEEPLEPSIGNLYPVPQGMYFVKDLGEVEDLGYQAGDDVFGAPGAGGQGDEPKDDESPE